MTTLDPIKKVWSVAPRGPSETSAPLFDAPNWPGGPEICRAENLPAFETMEALNKFIARYCPSVKQVNKWQCDSCGMLHLYTVAASPGGDSSGQGRNSKWKTREQWQAFFNADAAGDMVGFLEDQERRELEKKGTPRG
jgi:hypothetical protein